MNVNVFLTNFKCDIKENWHGTFMTFQVISKDTLSFFVLFLQPLLSYIKTLPASPLSCWYVTMHLEINGCQSTYSLQLVKSS